MAAAIPAPVRAGNVYVNALGAVLSIKGNYMPRPGEPRVLSSDIFEAVSHDPLFGNTYYLVTAHSLASAGYQLQSGSDK